MLATSSAAVDGRSLGSSENAAAKAARNFPASTPGDRRERSRFMGRRPPNTMTLWKTLRLTECRTHFLVWILGRSNEELDGDGCKRIDIVDKRWRRAREPLRGAVRRFRLRRDSYLDQRLRKPKPRDSSPFTFQDHVAGRHHPVMDACARSKVDCVGQLPCALQDLCNRSRAVPPQHRVHGSTLRDLNKRGTGCPLRPRKQEDGPDSGDQASSRRAFGTSRADRTALRTRAILETSPTCG